MKWINVNDELPESHLFDEPFAEYYLIWISRYGYTKAMYIDDTWMSDYTAKIVGKVTHWMKIESPN